MDFLHLSAPRIFHDGKALPRRCVHAAERPDNAGIDCDTCAYLETHFHLNIELRGTLPILVGDLLFKLTSLGVSESSSSRAIDKINRTKKACQLIFYHTLSLQRLC